MIWIGNEFEPNETALKNGKYPVKIIRWDKSYGGWWYIQSIESGLMGYTRKLEKL